MRVPFKRHSLFLCILGIANGFAFSGCGTDESGVQNASTTTRTPRAAMPPPEDERGGMNGYDINMLSAMLNTVRYVPGGTYEIGEPRVNFPDRVPRHAVELGEFWIIHSLVTVELFAAFIEKADGYNKKELWSDEGWNWKERENIASPLDWETQRASSNHPVTGVSMYEAEALAKSLGIRLCSEFEWEIAAGGGRYVYPWGNTFLRSNAAWSGGEIADVGMYPAGVSPYGILDAVGLVLQWTTSEYKLYPGNTTGFESPYLSVGRRVLRGSTYQMVDYAAPVTYRTHALPDLRDPRVGIRLCTSDHEFIMNNWIDLYFDTPDPRPGMEQTEASLERERIEEGVQGR